MFKFFDGLVNIIGTVVDFVVSAVTNLVTVVARSVQAMAYVVEVLAFLPAYVKVYVLAMVGVSVILFLINKGSD